MAEKKVTIAQYDYPRNEDGSIRMIPTIDPATGREIEGKAKFPDMDRVNDGKVRGVQVGPVYGDRPETEKTIVGYRHNITFKLGEPAELPEEVVTTITTAPEFRGPCGAPHYRKV